MHRLLCVSLLVIGTTSFNAPVLGKATSRGKVGTQNVEQARQLPVVNVANEKIVLPNGLTIIVHEDHKVPVVSMATYYRVGSGHETPGRTGFAHLFEHLMFNGSQHANTDWFEAVNQLGATGMNGSTGFDRTNYYQTVPKAALEKLLWLESDRMQNLLPAIDQATLDEQRKVVQNEKRQGENTPLGEVPEKLYSSIYPPGHPYSWTPIGSMQDLEAATLDDVKAFFKKWYGPTNAVIVLSGDITVAEARELATKYYGDIPAGPALTQPREYIAKMTGTRRDTIQAAIATPQLIKTWNVPGWAHPEAQLLRLAAGVLSDGSSSRLRKRLIRELEIASDVSASVNLQEIGSQFSISATARPGVTLARLETEIDAELAKLLKDGPTQDELERQKFARYAAYVRGLSSTMNKAQMLAEGEIWAGTPNFYKTRQKVTNEATRASVTSVARKWLSDGQYVLEIQSFAGHRTTGKPVDRTTMPAIGAMPPFTLPPLKRATLSNGLQVMLAERHDVPTVHVSMHFQVGSLPDRDPASLGFSTGAAGNGTTTRDVLEVEKLQQELGAGIGWQRDRENARFSVNALKVKLAPSLDLYADMLLNPAFPKEEWERQLRRFEAVYEENKLLPEGKAGNVYSKKIYGENHPYGAELTPTIARRLKVEDFQAFHRRWNRPDLATILVVGDTTLSEIVPLLEQRFGRWKAVGPRPVKAPLPPATAPTRPQVILFDQPGATSSLVTVAHTGPARNHPDYDLLTLANAVLGGGFISRLNLNLREDKGWSYGARSKLAEQAGIGEVTAGAAVQTDKTAASMAEIARELRDIASSRPPTPAEIQTAKNTMLLGLTATLQDPSGAAKLYQNMQKFDLPENYYNTYVQRIQGFSTEQVQAAAKRLYRPSELTWFVVGDLAKIEKEVRALKLGEVMVYDADGKRLR